MMAVAFFCLLILDPVILHNRGLRNPRLAYISIVALILTLLAGLRHETVGGRDVYISYKNSFHEARLHDWPTIFSQLAWPWDLEAEGKEPGYVLFERLIGALTDDYQVYLMAVALVFMVPFAIMVYRYSSDPLISFLVYYVVFFSFFSVTGFRQTLATAIAVLAGYSSLANRRPIRFALLQFFAFTFHRSSIAFALLYPLTAERLSRVRLWFGSGVLLAIGVGVALGPRFLTPIAESLGYGDQITNQIGGTETFLSLLAIIFIACLWRWNEILKISHASFVNILGVAVGLFFTALTVESQSFMRIQQYFTLLIVLAVPDIIVSFKDRERLIVRTVVIGVLAILLLSLDRYYIFFWQY